MRVVFLEDVPGVAHGGDVKEVKNGFARNYLIPKSLATPANHNALQRIESLRKQAESGRIKAISDMRALASELDGTQVNIPMRSGANGRLYGSVTNVMIADELASITEKEIDRRLVEIADPIRALGMFDVTLHLHADVDATIKVLVHPAGTDPEAYLASLQPPEPEAEEEQEEEEESEEAVEATEE
jgi:large subunit ribosomal protein L9